MSSARATRCCPRTCPARLRDAAGVPVDQLEMPDLSLRRAEREQSCVPPGVGGAREARSGSALPPDAYRSSALLDLVTFAAAAAIDVRRLATWWDIRERRIPNWLSGGAFVASLVASLATDGIGLSACGLGFLLGGLALFLPFVLGAVGAGDVKFAAVAGAWLGPAVGIQALLLGTAIGLFVGLASAAVIGRRRAPRRRAPRLPAGEVALDHGPAAPDQRRPRGPHPLCAPLAAGVSARDLARGAGCSSSRKESTSPRHHPRVGLVASGPRALVIARCRAGVVRTVPAPRQQRRGAAAGGDRGGVAVGTKLGPEHVKVVDWRTTGCPHSFAKRRTSSDGSPLRLVPNEPLTAEKWGRTGRRPPLPVTWACAASGSCERSGAVGASSSRASGRRVVTPGEALAASQAGTRWR